MNNNPYELKQELLPLAFKRAKAVKSKIKELKVTPEMDEDAQVALAEKLCETKYGEDYSSKDLQGMEWYISNLVKLSGMEDKKLLDYMYQDLLPANSSYDELVAMLGEV